MNTFGDIAAFTAATAARVHRVRVANMGVVLVVKSEKVNGHHMRTQKEAADKRPLEISRLGLLGQHRPSGFRHHSIFPSVLMLTQMRKKAMLRLDSVFATQYCPKAGDSDTW